MVWMQEQGIWARPTTATKGGGSCSKLNVVLVQALALSPLCPEKKMIKVKSATPGLTYERKRMRNNL